MSDKIEKLYDELSKMTVLEVSGLIKRLEEGWGVSAAAAVPMAMPMPGRVAAPLPRSRRRPSSTSS